jgi:aspartyl-tRNA(Asn)/glutamyl-tRNA(Gln) amidotransferase subunit A
MPEGTALELAIAIKEKKLTVPEVVNAYIEKIEKYDKEYKTFLTVIKENALQRAHEVQAHINSGETLSPLAGVPIALKDNISVKEIEMTCASKMLKGYKPVFNATVVEKLENAGLIVIGKLNMDEFALGASSDCSAAAIAAGEVPLAIGTDTGGNIRQSCAFCGVTGIKPTYGSVSRFGIAAYASSLDQAGPIGQDINDCAALLSIISGPDEKDGTCVIEKPFDFFNDSTQDVKGIKIGIPNNFINSSMAAVDEDIKTAILAAAKEYKEIGAIVEEFEMPLIDYIIPAYCIIGSAEASSNLAKYDGLKYGYRSANAKTLSETYRLSRSEGFGLEVKRKILFGSFVLSAGNYDTYYRKALQVRTLIKDAYKKLFGHFDVILSPVTPATAYKSGNNIDDPMKVYMENLFTASVNLAGLPAVALPCGFDKQELPIGFQLIGNTFSEKRLIDTARIYQSRTGYHKRKPGGIS